MYLDRIFGPSLSLSEITLLFDLSLYLDRTLAQRKSKVKVIDGFRLKLNNKKLNSLKLIVRTMWWYQFTKTAKNLLGNSIPARIMFVSDAQFFCFLVLQKD